MVWFPNVPDRRKEASLWDRLSSLIFSEGVDADYGSAQRSEKISADQRFSFLLWCGIHRLALRIRSDLSENPDSSGVSSESGFRKIFSNKGKISGGGRVS